MSSIRFTFGMSDDGLQCDPHHLNQKQFKVLLCKSASSMKYCNKVGMNYIGVRNSCFASEGKIRKFPKFGSFWEKYVQFASFVRYCEKKKFSLLPHFRSLKLNYFHAFAQTLRFAKLAVSTRLRLLFLDVAFKDKP